jgi:predicted metal-binding protein
MTAKIWDKAPEDILQADLEKFRQTALELGATGAKIITADQVVVDERVRAKCMNPKCNFYGTNGNCPPHAPDLDTVRKTIQSFHYGIMIINQFPIKAAAEGKRRGPEELKDNLQNHKIIAKIESQAFYAGYYLALGFGDGPCKPRYCPDRECSVLTGKGCRMGLRARYSMESWGMNAYLMATRAGWDIYPIGTKTGCEDVPYEVTLGLVMVY